MVVHTLEKDGASKKAHGVFHRSVVKSVLLRNCETWMFTEQGNVPGVGELPSLGGQLHHSW